MPDYEIITPLSVEECRRRLTGRERFGRLSDGFARPLGLSGQIGANFLSIELDRGGLSGHFETVEDGTRVRIRRKSSSPWWFDKLAFPPIFFAGFIALTWHPGESPTPPFICITATLGIMTIRSWRIWRRYTNTSLSPDEAVQIIANLVLATQWPATHQVERNLSRAIRRTGQLRTVHSACRISPRW